LRVVLDTNVAISALVFPGGLPEAVYRLGLEGRITPVTSRALLAELGAVLADKFAWEDRLVEEAIAQLSRVADIVEPQQVVTTVEADPDDDRVLEAALEGRASLIVSGDRHLLSLGAWEGIPIVAPAAFLEDASWAAG
jgi:putative PIN family toxin of toxin-antitoxin system